MYQGCNKTAVASQFAIADSFVKLLKEKEYSKISVSEICSLAGVSRQTFYSLFESKENIVVFELAKNYLFDPEEECKCCGRKPSLEELSRGYAQFIVEKSDFIALLVRNGIIYQMQECLYHSFCKCSSDEMTADFIAGGLTAVARHYCFSDQKMTCSELQMKIQELFSGFPFR